MGIIYAYLKLNNTTKAKEYFDRLPVNNSICDLNDGPQLLGITLEFSSLYSQIFNYLNLAFAKDSKRKIKVRALYALYLYSPCEFYDYHRYKRADAAALTQYIKNAFNAKAATALYNMRCHFGQPKEAFEVLALFLEHYVDPEKNDIYFSELVELSSDEDLCQMVKQIITALNEDKYSIELFSNCIFNELIQTLHEHKEYAEIREIAQYISTKAILDSECSFECAFAYGEIDNPRSTELYKGIITKQPQNSSAINNLGVQYEHQGDSYKALECYEKAFELDPNDKIHERNLKRIRESIDDQLDTNLEMISNSISFGAVEAIGYTVELCKRIHKIQDSGMKDIILRDLQECAIAVVAGQNKTATIMCGSIIEALLMLKITELHEKYDISEISKKNKASNYPIAEMGLNELLYVANKCGIIDKNNYHLSHYIRDYRNIVHPAKEIRMREDITRENVLTMWAVLKRLITDLFP